MDEKTALRKAALARRRAMDPAEAARASAAMARAVIALPEFAAADALYAYIAAKNEVETRDIIAAALAAGIPVCAPALEAQEMRWRTLHGIADTVTGAHGLLEPSADAPLAPPPTRKSLCLVPGVIFRPDGHRIGHGGGHFDRFLRDFPGLSIGLAYDWQLDKPFTPEPHDVPVRMIQTERRQLYSGAPPSFGAPPMPGTG